jgi:hypothetical protein
MRTLRRPLRPKELEPPRPECLQQLARAEEFLQRQCDGVVKMIKAILAQDMMDCAEAITLKAIIFPFTCAEYSIRCIENLSPAFVEKIAKLLVANSSTDFEKTSDANDSLRSVSITDLMKRYIRKHIMKHLPCVMQDNGVLLCDYEQLLQSLPDVATDFSLADSLPKNTIKDRDGVYFRLEVDCTGDRMQRIPVTDEEQRLLQGDARQCFDRAHKKRSWLERGAQFLQEILE